MGTACSLAALCPVHYTSGDVPHATLRLETFPGSWRLIRMDKSTRAAYVRSLSPETAVHQFGLELHYFVEGKDSDGQLAIVHYVSAPGHEPPPHVHDDEDEVFYLLEGEMDAYCGDEVFHVRGGECLFLPSGKPHAWLIRTSVLHTLIVTHPARLDRIFRETKRHEDEVQAAGGTYRDAYEGDRGKEMLAIAARHGIHVLTSEQVREQLPSFPSRIS